MRTLVRETVLHPSNFVLPLFVVPGENVRREIPSLPGVFHHSVDRVTEIAKQTLDAGVCAVMLFGIPERKDPMGQSAWDPHGPVARAVQAIKKATPELVVITDVCMCEYTDHGHCGVLQSAASGPYVHNDQTLPLLAQEALCHAQAGADLVAPSDMMDGRVGFIRQALDEKGFTETGILSYAAKYASAFYGPFRDAAQSTPSQGDRKAYQMDPANGREALREVTLDIEQGADMVMVKPALPYLDVIHQVRALVHVPVAAYQVSGEYAMIKALAQSGGADHDAAMLESLTSIKRAGADMIISYFALQAAQLL